MNEVRIIGGKYRGRKLRFESVADLRPTLGRVRETLFNWLHADVINARVLDLYAGSGALAFEALSRGATSATLVENNARAVRSLRRNAALLGLQSQQCHIQQSSVERYLRRAAHGRFDLIFVDPPFAQAGAGAGALIRRLSADWLASQGLIYLELPRQHAQKVRETLDAGGFTVHRDKAFGDCQALLLRASGDGKESGHETDV
jgi:16S rRNA (guanine966-N2)-methyltransferase